MAIWLYFTILSILGLVSSIISVEGKSDETIHLSVVACGDRLEETLMMIKSTILFTQSHMHYHILADDDLRPLFEKQLNGWPEFIRSKYSFSLYPITYPEGENEVQWKKVFKPCATQRLFIPYVFEKYKVDVRRLIYVDTDILFFTPLDNVWAKFELFNSSHVSALTPEHEAPWMGWYNRFARHPYYGEMGVNSGVMWMDLPGIQASDWLSHMVDYYKVYRYNITWGDQDLINIFFHNYPDKLLVLPCEWNYRPDHCMYGSVCKTAESNGIFVVHGNRGYYHNDKQPAFKAIYQSIRNYKFGQDLEEHLLTPLAEAYRETESTYCGKIGKFIFRELQQSVKNAKERTRASEEVKDTEIGQGQVEDNGVNKGQEVKDTDVGQGQVEEYSVNEGQEVKDTDIGQGQVEDNGVNKVQEMKDTAIGQGQVKDTSVNEDQEVKDTNIGQGQVEVKDKDLSEGKQVDIKNENVSSKDGSENIAEDQSKHSALPASDQTHEEL